MRASIRICYLSFPPEHHVDGEISGRIDTKKKNGNVGKFGKPSLEEPRRGATVDDRLIDGAETVGRLQETNGEFNPWCSLGRSYTTKDQYSSISYLLSMEGTTCLLPLFRVEESCGQNNS